MRKFYRLKTFLRNIKTSSSHFYFKMRLFKSCFSPFFSRKKQYNINEMKITNSYVSSELDRRHVVREERESQRYFSHSIARTHMFILGIRRSDRSVTKFFYQHVITTNQEYHVKELKSMTVPVEHYQKSFPWKHQTLFQFQAGRN